MLHLGVRRLATERMLNNLIDRESFVDQRHVRLQPVMAADWLRPATGRADWHLVARKLDFGPRLPEIERPVLMLCGRHDPQYPPACSAELAAKIRCVHLVWFEHSGHYPFIEEPAAFWAAVSEFLNPTFAHGR
jgi:proline iminopeptidase